MPASRFAVILLALALPTLTLSACNSSSAGPPPLEGAAIGGPFELVDKAGQTVRWEDFEGKWRMVYFGYAYCPDVCPLIVSSLAAAQRQLGAQARRLQILAVTVDPRRDTPSAIRAFLATREATGRMDYLLGTRHQLERTWKRWDVAVRTGSGKLTNGHSAVIYGISASGRMAVVYPSNVTPAEITHDVPLLARS